mmetsp:Transcript_4249/g.9656  ORF Transcript_4249/g.9656 Transcript_4249/m.9656 type:complete len:130 (-) Transcript_4249:154-543(-)
MKGVLVGAIFSRVGKLMGFIFVRAKNVDLDFKSRDILASPAMVEHGQTRGCTSMKPNKLVGFNYKHGTGKKCIGSLPDFNQNMTLSLSVSTKRALGAATALPASTPWIPAITAMEMLPTPKLTSCYAYL